MIDLSSKIILQQTMWQVAVAAAVAGSGLIAKRIFSPNPFSSSSETIQTEPNNKEAQLQQQEEQNSTFFNQKLTNNGEERDGVFRFSSSPSSKHRNLGKKIRVAHRKVGRFDDNTAKKKKKVTVCLKRRKTCRNATESNCNFSLSKDCSSFGWGLGLGMICMMSAGKEDIRKLSNTIDETAKVVKELKSELSKQKSVPCHKLLSSDNSGNTVDTIQKPVKLQANNESCSMHNHPIDMKLYSHLADNDYASSVLTEEHQQEGAEMDQLEAELECELQKLPWCSSETSKHEDSIKMERQGMNRNSASHNYDGVHPAELGNKLSALLIEQQESHISELESELNSAYYKLQEKEAELRSLKECVRRLTEFSLCTVSDEETDVQRDELEEPDHNTLVSADNASIGTKRAMLFS